MADLKITSDRRNELLRRRELSFTLGYAGSTPSRSEVMGKVCAILNLDEKKVVLDSVKTRFGERKMLGIARVYDEEEMLAKTERPYLTERGKPKAKEGAEAEATKEAPKEAAKAAPKEPAKEAPKEVAKPAPKEPAKEAGA
ncbi:MAG: 30S ribosomal protein S24e [Methanomicrobiales archaeon]|jgi:small subunit ribosomal protein S24e